MASTYKMNIAGCDRELEMFSVNEKLDIAAFILFNDIEITEKAAQALIQVCPEHDVVLTAEAKSIPLAYEFARQGCGQYVVARKGLKVYMRNPVSVTVKSITTANQQTLHLGQTEVKAIRGKRVLILDDVISTGESLKAMEQLVEAAGGNVVGKAAVLAEGDAADRDDIIFLEKLPLFFK
ncbi:MAG: adenine phosphoribosyltransferase [Clostridia bacterium]|nr:adenine phosphoribosyltransferase [Clostridia bacterium]